MALERPQTSGDYRSFYEEELSIENPKAIINEMTSQERREYREILMNEVNDRIQQVLQINQLEITNSEQ